MSHDSRSNFRVIFMCKYYGRVYCIGIRFESVILSYASSGRNPSGCPSVHRVGSSPSSGSGRASTPGRVELLHPSILRSSFGYLIWFRPPMPIRSDPISYIPVRCFPPIRSQFLLPCSVPSPILIRSGPLVLLRSVHLAFSRSDPVPHTWPSFLPNASHQSPVRFGVFAQSPFPIRAPPPIRSENLQFS